MDIIAKRWILKGFNFRGNMVKLSEIIKQLTICNYFGEPNFNTLNRAWNYCNRGSVMINILQELKIEEKLIIKILGEFLRLMLEFLPEKFDSKKIEIFLNNPSIENINNILYAKNTNSEYFWPIRHTLINMRDYIIYNQSLRDLNIIPYICDMIATNSHCNINYINELMNCDKKCAQIVREHIPFELIKLAVIFN